MHSGTVVRLVGKAREGVAAGLMCGAAIVASWAFPVVADGGQPGVVERFAGAPGVSVAGGESPDAGEALRSLGLVRAWLERGAVEGSGPAMACACVTIRLNGAIIGRAEAWARPGLDAGQVLASAAGAAIAQSLARIPIEGDALAQTRRREIVREMVTISVEMGGTPIPMDVESFDRVSQRVSPGLTGLGARMGATGGRTALVFPSAMVSRNMDGGAALASAAAEVLQESDATMAGSAALVERGVRFLSFECVWAAEVGVDRAGLILHRGGRVAEEREVSTGMLRELGARVGDAIAQRGPSAGFDRALAAYALARWAGTSDSGTAGQRAVWRDRCVRWLIEGAAGEGEMHAGVAGLWLMAEREVAGLAPGVVGGSPEASALSVGRGRASEALMRGVSSSERGTSAAMSALMAWAAAGRGVALGDVVWIERSEAVLAGLYAGTPASEWVSMWPWAVWAEAEITSARVGVGGASVAMDRAAALREVREQVWRHQISASDVGAGDRDMVGGITFTRGRQSLPTWQSLRPMAALATMMGDARLTTDAEFSGQLLRMLSSLRFVRQLCADEAVMSWSTGTAWGVRSAPWTGEQPAEASPMGLLVIAEALRSLEAVQARRQRP